jgi:hypothetical protein
MKTKLLTKSPVGPIGIVLLSACLWQSPAQELTQVYDAPETGTFFLLSGQTEEGTSPPYPFDPYQGTLPIYQIAGFGGAYLVGDSAEDYALYQAVMRGQRLSLYEAAWGDGGMMQMSGDGPPELPGDGEGGGGEWEPPAYSPPEYGSNDLWLEITNYLDGTAGFIIHTPEEAAYDLFATTNLTLTVPGLNATNWVWLWRTEVGETNFAVVNLWPELGFFRLGTLLDTDADGLTDAYELLCSHTDINDADTDADGMSDYDEVLLGRNPLAAGTAPDTGGVIGLQLFTALR